MKRFLVAAFALLLFAMPMSAEAQQKKKKQQQDDPNPIVFLIGLFSIGNCIAHCGTTTKFITKTATVVIPQSEGPPITITRVSTSAVKKIMNGYVAGAALCTFLWPFINHLSGGPEPTPEEAIQAAISCWVPGLGIVLYLQSQYAP
jgi:hypothetical protein